MAGLIILAHTVVPHHHHFEISHSSEEESACEVPVHGQNQEKPDTHCHAFNILVSERTSTISLNKSLSDHLSFFTVGVVVQVTIFLYRPLTSGTSCNCLTFVSINRPAKQLVCMFILIFLT